MLTFITYILIGFQVIGYQKTTIVCVQFPFAWYVYFYPLILRLIKGTTEQQL